MNADQLRQIAVDYRRLWNKQSNGLVLIFEGTACGWIFEMRSASEWQPGTVAVGPLGVLYVARGGNEREGALAWDLVSL